MAADSDVAVGDPPPAKKKRKASMSPTARSLAECRKRGWVAGVVERYNSHTKQRNDLFGIIDIVAITPSKRLVGIQAGSGNRASGGGDHAAHRTKILAEKRAPLWVEAGADLQLWSWSYVVGKGGRRRYTLRVETYDEMREAAR